MSVASNLLRLQELDLDIMRNNKLATELPHKEQIAKLRRGIKAAQAELMRITGKRKDLEIELDDNAQAKQKASDEVDMAQLQAEEGDQSYRQIQDLEAKLSMLAKRLEKLDFDRERLNGELEQVLEEEHAKEKLIQRASDEEARLLEDYKSELDKLAKLVDTARKDREYLCEDIPTDVLERYMAARKRFNGIAVESLQQGGKPSVCRVALQPSQLPAIKSDDGICECPYCHRILIVT